MSKELKLTVNIDEELIADHVTKTLEEEVKNKVEDVLNKRSLYSNYRDTTFIRDCAKEACVNEAKKVIAEHEDEIINAIVQKVSSSYIHKKKLKTAMALIEEADDE